MKRFRYLILLILAPAVLPACGEGEVMTAPILKDQTGWVVDSVAPGMVWYNYTGYYEPSQANQIVNVLDLDLSDPDYSLEIVYVDRDSLSSVAAKHGAFAGINGTYESDASFVKTDGVIHTRNKLEPGHLRFWKHEGAIFYDHATNGVTLDFGTDEQYESSDVEDILSGSPMLIDDYDPVGERFTGDIEGLVLDSLEYEDYRRHQGVRHPRTALAMTENNHLLMITVDGRREQSSGMSARELTQFVQRYFAPRSALNIDGGGSTTMWIKERNTNQNNVVNYPTDNKQFDHYGQRRVSSFILVKQK